MAKAQSILRAANDNSAPTFKKTNAVAAWALLALALLGGLYFLFS